LYERYCLRHPSYHQLRSEHVEVKGMVMLEEQDHPMNHRLGEEGMNMVELDDIDTVEEHFHPMNHRPEVEGMGDMVDEHFHPMNHRPEVEGMDMVDTDMREYRAVELEVVKREPEGVVLAGHWTDDGAGRHRRTCQEWKELAKSGCSKDQSTFVTQASNCTSR
jgi:hypothetical protein